MTTSTPLNYSTKKGNDSNTIEEITHRYQPHNSLLQNTGSIPFPFLPLYSQYTFGQRIKSSLPFSKLFFTSNTKSNMLDHHYTSPLEKKQPLLQNDTPFQIIHDEELCMFYMKLDSKGTTAAICYLPTTMKNVIEAYHIEIPLSYRHRGLGDKLVKECLDWAQESGTLVIPTCAFVKRHLESIGFQKYDPVILDHLPPPKKLNKY